MCRVNSPPSFRVMKSTVLLACFGVASKMALLVLIEREGFDVFITDDRNMLYHQQFAGRSFAVLIMSTINWPVLKLHIEKIVVAVATAQPGTVTQVDCGSFVP